MKSIFFFSRFGMAVLGLFLLFSTNSCKKDRGGVYFGESLALGGGTAKTYAIIDYDGFLTELGVVIDDTAMASLPGAGADLSLDLPDEFTLTAFTHLELSWNPAGHEPLFAYGAPHFDVHFYYQTEADRMTIMPTDSVEFNNVPAAGYFPANYSAGLPPLQGVPMMGVHWADVTSPEFNGGTFTSSFIYGSYDGNVTFLEPMITKAFIEANAEYNATIPQPSLYPVSGRFYPTMYGFYHDVADQEYHIYCKTFVLR